MRIRVNGLDTDGSILRDVNGHIHLIFSERTLLEVPIDKTATRNMFYDEQGNHVRTKKEILDADGNIRKRCKIIKKGEVYERMGCATFIVYTDIIKKVFSYIFLHYLKVFHLPNF